MSDYILNPGYFDEDAQRDPVWVEWAKPERIAAQIDQLFTETLPSVRCDKPMPEADRFSDTMMSWIAEVFEQFFPDENALYERENHGVADQFVCYIGEALRQAAGGEWFNNSYPTASVLYDEKLAPAIGYRWGEDIGPDDITDTLFRAVEADGGPDFLMEIESDIYSRAADYTQTHGIPHEPDELKARHRLA
ncbi:hypothetical protein [Nocardia heshunensis]